MPPDAPRRSAEQDRSGQAYEAYRASFYTGQGLVLTAKPFHKKDTDEARGAQRYFVEARRKMERTAS